jgi:hypothetical protein
MKRLFLVSTLLLLVMIGLAVHPVFAASTNSTLSIVRQSTASFHDLSIAKSAGYGLVPGLDYCFDNPGVGGMGIHYINTSLLDNVVDASMPEALVYSPDQSGQLRLVAVEYIVPAAGWDAVYSSPPSLFGRSFELNAPLGVYALHAWIWQPNPLGMFYDWNPMVSCGS